MNRWTAPLVTAALLSVPAVLLGWNAGPVAATVTAPWRVTADLVPAVTQAPTQAVVTVPGALAGAAVPTTAPAAAESLRGTVAPSSETGRSVVHTVTHTVGTNLPERGQDDVSEQPNTRPSEAPGPVVPSDPTNPATEPAPDAPEQEQPQDGTTPGGQPIPDGGYVDEDGHRWYNNGGQVSEGNIPPASKP